MDWRSSPECPALMPPKDDFSNSLLACVQLICEVYRIAPGGVRQGKRWSAEQRRRIGPAAATLATVRAGCRPHPMAAPPLSRWRRQWGGLESADAKR